MKYIGSLVSSIGEIKNALQELFIEDQSLKHKHVRYNEGSFYLHSGKLSRFGFRYGSSNRKKKQENGKKKAYELFQERYPALYSNYSPHFNFGVIKQMFNLRCKDGLLLASDFHDMCTKYLRDYDCYISDYFKKKYEGVLDKMIKIYLKYDVFVFGHKHTQESSSGDSFIRDFFLFLRDLKNVNISQGHVILYEMMVSLHSHYRRRRLSDYSIEKNYKFKPNNTYKNPNSLISHLDALEGDPCHKKVKWFADNNVDVLFYDD
ncbi:MAG: hypothetical protein GY750_15655 [Lentisphaerae bacterium]|nr:hypothetical protein [Lentisphaerota bacterium]MCP4102833.1 hypothetical protein [Lentisphaerota bacterium]